MMLALILALVANPLLRMYPENLKFLLTFDDGSIQPQVGAVKVVKPPKNPTYEISDGGVIGKCLSAGRITFGKDVDGRPVVDLLGKGTVICWIRYKTPVEKGNSRPGFTFSTLRMNAKDEIIMMKQSGIAWMNSFYEYVTDKRHTFAANTGCSFDSWKCGEWRMYVCAWDQEKLYCWHSGMFDGGYSAIAYDRKFKPLWELAIQAPYFNQKGRFFEIDEYAYLDRLLTPDELRAVYRAFRPRPETAAD